VALGALRRGSPPRGARVWFRGAHAIEKAARGARGRRASPAPAGHARSPRVLLISVADTLRQNAET
jgi:hypothetical protein